MQSDVRMIPSEPLYEQTLPLALVERVEQSYRKHADRVRSLTGVFFEEVFRIRPGLRSRFRVDASLREITDTFLGFVITNLRSRELSPLLEHMGQRGMLVGLSRDDLDAFGRAMLYMLRDLEGPGWSRETANAWAVLFTWVITAMRKGMGARVPERPG